MGCCLSVSRAVQSDVIDKDAAILKPVFNATIGEYWVAHLLSGMSKQS